MLYKCNDFAAKARINSYFWAMIATIPFLEKRFETFNNDYFAGALPPVPIKLSRAVRSLGSCTYKKRRKLFGSMEYSDFCIRISTKFDLSENELEDILLHEMIHYEILVNQRKDTSAHGRLFRARMKEFNEKYGRHISVSHRFTPQQQAAAIVPSKPVLRAVALVRMRDGHVGVKVLPRVERRLKAYRRGLLLSGQVSSVTFYLTDDPYFGRFPKSTALNVFFPKDSDFLEHFKISEILDI